MEDVRIFFNRLGFTPFEGHDPNSGRDFYSVGYEIGRDSGVIFYALNHLVENIEITPEIIKQKEGSPREWIAYSHETITKKYGKPSRVEFGLDLQENITIGMIMYFDPIDLIAFYSGFGRTLRLCPFTFPFDYVNLSMGVNPPNPPCFPRIPLEKATSLTIDLFTQLMLGDPQNACFEINPDVFQ